MQDRNKGYLMTWSDYWTIARRRRWAFLGPLFALGLLGCVAIQVWPRQYRAEAVIAAGQKVPEQYVTPNVVSNPDEWVQTMARQVLSSERLRGLIEQFGLYRKERERFSNDEVTDRMRRAIAVEPVRSSSDQPTSTTFRICFLAPNPAVAQAVTGRIASLFIDESQLTREQQSVNTTHFLESQLEQARQDLEGKEQRLRSYKQRYLGELPEQQPTNLQLLGSLQTQLASASMSLDRAEQEKEYLEAMKAQYHSINRIALTDTNGHAQSVDSILSTLRAQLAELESKYTPRYPDVVKLKKEIAKWEAVKKQNGKDATAMHAEATGDNSDPALVEIDSRLKAARSETRSLKSQIENLQSRLRLAQEHLNLVPLRQEELTQVTSDYDNARKNYDSLLQKKMQSELATNLEKQQRGFRIVQSASLPKKPAEPNRLEILLGSWVLGIVAGLVLATLREATDTRLHSEGEISAYAGLPVLLSVPILRSNGEEERHRTRQGLEWAAVVALVLVSCATGILTYLKG